MKATLRGPPCRQTRPVTRVTRSRRLNGFAERRSVLSPLLNQKKQPTKRPQLAAVLRRAPRQRAPYSVYYWLRRPPKHSTADLPNRTCRHPSRIWVDAPSEGSEAANDRRNWEPRKLSPIICKKAPQDCNERALRCRTNRANLPPAGFMPVRTRQHGTSSLLSIRIKEVAEVYRPRDPVLD